MAVLPKIGVARIHDKNNGLFWRYNNKDSEVVATEFWQRCAHSLQEELPLQQFNTWIRPLQADMANSDTVVLSAPNRFVRDWVREKYLNRIESLLEEISRGQIQQISLQIGNKPSMASATPAGHAGDAAMRHNAPLDAIHAEQYPIQENTADSRASSSMLPNQHSSSAPLHDSQIVEAYTFDTFIEGKSNQLARAAALQVAANPGGSYNPLFLYGSSGLGKTHLMHAVGNELLKHNPKAKVLYIHSDKFVADMVKAYQLKALDDFKRFYHGLDALLVDDIQFFAKKEGTQEQFFSAFNALLNGGQQIILTSDKFPKEIKGLDERLKSRFSWGLTVAVEPPELETRVAILMKKAEQLHVTLPREAAFFIAQRIRSNVRDLEGALKNVIAVSQFKGRAIDVDLVREALKDLLSVQDRLVSIDNIQKTVAEYYKIRVADLLSKRRNRSIARPRQLAMALAKELTNRSLPEIGDAFGGRDHTTVLHACRKIQELKETDTDIQEDMKNLLRTLTT